MARAPKRALSSGPKSRKANERNVQCHITNGTLSFITTILGLLWMAGCATLTGIPDLNTPDGQIYARRCGACHEMAAIGAHGVPDPRFRSMAEWKEILPKMDRLIRERGHVPLNESEREAIVRYLKQHAKL